MRAKRRRVIGQLTASNPRAVTRQFLQIFLPFLLVLCGVLYWAYNLEVKSNLKVFEQTELKSVGLAQASVIEALGYVFSDLLILSQHHELQLMLEDGGVQDRAMHVDAPERDGRRGGMGSRGCGHTSGRVYLDTYPRHLHSTLDTWLERTANLGDRGNSGGDREQKKGGIYVQRHYVAAPNRSGRRPPHQFLIQCC